jgi:hypothetical protein
VVDIVITEWALDAYLELKHRNVFSTEEYRQTIRVDVQLLKGGFPTTHPKFENSKFWGPATDRSGKTIPAAFKMKWHQVGPGAVQLRLLVVVHGGRVFLCRAYVKHNEKTDHREVARLKIHLKDIINGQFVARGML